MYVRYCEDKESIARIQQLRHVVFVVEQGYSPAIETDRYDAPGQAHYYIAKEGALCIGCARWVRMDTDTGKFGRLAVVAEHRGSGVAVALMKYMEQHAREHFGIRHLYCHAQCDKKGFYRKLGYVEHGDEFIDGDDQGVGGTLHIKMVKLI